MLKKLILKFITRYTLNTSIKMAFQVGDIVQVQVPSWNAKIINELDNEMVYVTTPSGLGRDVSKNNIRETLFGNLLTEFPNGKKILVINIKGTNW